MKFFKLTIFFIALTLLFNGITFKSFSQSNPLVLAKLLEADHLMITHNYEKAIEILDSLASSNDELAIKEKLALCYLRSGASFPAKDIYKGILKDDSTHLIALNQLGQIAQKEGNLSESMAYFHKLSVLDSTNSYYFKQLGKIQSEQGKILGAISMYTKALELNKRDLENYASLAELLIDVEMTGVADSLIAKGLTYDSLNYSLNILKAKSAFAQNQFEKVIKVVEAILIERDTTPILANFLGSSFFRIKDYKKTIPCMQFLLEANYEQDWIYYYLGISYRETDQNELSAVYLQKAIEKGISKNIDSYYTQLGITFDDSGKYDEAIKAFKKAYEYDGDILHLYRIATCYDKSKERKSAILYYNKYLSSGDTTKLLLTYSQKRVAQLKSNLNSKKSPGNLTDSLALGD